MSSVQKIDKNEIINLTEKIEKEMPDFIEKDESENEKKFLTVQSVSKKEKLTEIDFPEKVQLTLSNYVKIKKEGISERALGVLKRTAVFMNPEYFKNLRMRLPLYNIPRFIDCSKESETYLLLPRGSINRVIEILGEVNVACEIIDEREEGVAIDVEFAGTLYDEQNDALNALMKSEAGILSCGTGFGKTVVAAALIAKLKTSTLILVQSHALLEQWKNAVKQFLNFDAGTIASGKDKSGGIVDIAIVNSLVQKKSDEVKVRAHKYGMLIVDECHHVSAFTTENLVASFCAKYVYGLTATPIRRDGHQKIIFYQCGNILYETSTKQMSQRQNFLHHFVPRFSSFHYSSEKDDGVFSSINEYYEKLIANEARNSLIASDVKNAVSNGRTALILSERVEHLETLMQKLEGFSQNVILITGRGTQKQKAVSLEKLKSVPMSESLIILATGKYAGEGFDYPRIDTLFLAMPFSWKGMLFQYCGRLHRNFVGKDEVVIYDYVDFRVPVFDRMYQKRLKGYKQLGYAIKPDIQNESGNEDENENISSENFSNENVASSKIFSSEDYAFVFENDVLHAKAGVVILAPYFSKYAVQKFLTLARELIAKGVIVKIVVQEPRDEEQRKKFNACVNLLDEVGCRVLQKEPVSQKIAIIDEKILWYGSINFLGYTESEECSMRICNAEIASEIEAEILG